MFGMFSIKIFLKLYSSKIVKYMDTDEIFSLIVERSSIRAFDSKPVEPDKIKKIFECARWAPSSYNRQPWRFIYATIDQKEYYDQLFDLLNESNKSWANSVPLIILTISEVFMKDRMTENKFAFHDTGMSLANLYIMARAIGLEIHPMGGYDKEKAKIILNIPDGFEPMVMIAVGYRKPLQEIGHDIKEIELKPRIRKNITEIIMNGIWRQ
jgi:nitroreductase